MNTAREVYKKPAVVSYSEAELLESIEACGPSLPGGP
jgi:hypothetical protein